MGIFSSSWKYHAYAASTSLFEEDNHPHTFQTVMLEGLRMDDSFANILRFSYNTDMYARTRSMVRYATREVDPYIRGLPTSNFTTFTVEKEWIDAAILREIKMPLEDFYWLKHGDFDPDFLTNMFIHDHYMDINYFPWPDGCLLPLANPNFDDGEDGWIPTDAVVNDRIGEITATTGTLYNESVGEVSPGEIISLRAVCDRGTNLANGQLGSLNLTFYDASGDEISTEYDTNTEGLNGAWELLTVIATAPAGTVTAKAWASGVIPIPSDFSGIHAFDILPEAGGSWAFIRLDFYPSSPGNGGFDFSYPAGWEPNNQWYFYEQFTEIEHTGAEEIWAKVEITSVISGTQSATNLEWGQSGNIGEWVDLWNNWELEFSDRIANGIPEIITIDLSIAKDNGSGAPDLATVVVYPLMLTAYRGSEDYIIQDTFNRTNGYLPNYPPTIDRRDNGGRLDNYPNGWLDLWQEENGYDNYDRGWMSIQNTSEVKTLAGDVTDECLYTIDAKVTDFQFACTLEWDSTSGGAGGIAGRIQDVANFWLLAIKNPASTDPILGLYKVVNDVHTLEASTTMTGLGPITGYNDAYPMRLTFEGNDIMGEFGFSDGSVNEAVYGRQFLTHTDATYNIETRIGLWTDGINTIYQEMSVYDPNGFDAIVWDTTPISSSTTDCGTVGDLIYFYESANGQTAHPYNSTCGYNDDPIKYEDVIDWRCTNFTTDTFVLKVEPVSGDTTMGAAGVGVNILEFGYYRDPDPEVQYGEWIDLFRSDVYLWAPISGSKSVVIDVTVAVDDGTKNPVAGTEKTKRVTMNATSTGPC